MTGSVESEVTLLGMPPAHPDQPARGQHVDRVPAEVQALVPVGGHNETGAVKAAAGAAPAIGLAPLVRGPDVRGLAPGAVVTGAPARRTGDRGTRARGRCADRRRPGRGRRLEGGRLASGCRG